MSEWSWVFLGYTIAYTAIAGYLLSLRVRQARAKRRARGEL